MKVKVCPGTLQGGYTSYSPKCLKSMFSGKKVDHILPYPSPGKNDDTTEAFIENRKRISISGVQEKMSLLLDGNVLRLTQKEEQGDYILKPIPRDLLRVSEVPANEHLTMQIAEQVYGIEVAKNAMIFFEDDEPAYLTNRFDVQADKSKKSVEDFATLAGKSNVKGGSNFKYDYSYEEIGELIRKYIPAWRVEMEKFYQVVLFNYLFSNGDAHLKNFSVIETTRGDFKLSPMYDLINTRLHVKDTDFALSKGLFKDEFKSDRYQGTGSPGKADFMAFGKRLGIRETRVDKIFGAFAHPKEEVPILVRNSFLSGKSKRGYLQMYRTKLNKLV
ncbi:MAG: HipA domain-containing protein [Bacteroidota bacterium]